MQQLASAFPVLAEAGGNLSAEAVRYWAPAPLLQVRTPQEAYMARALTQLRGSKQHAEVQQLASAFPVLAEAGGNLSAEAVRYWAPAPLLQVRTPQEAYMARALTQLRGSKQHAEVQHLVSAMPVLAEAGGNLSAEAVQARAPAPLLQMCTHCMAHSQERRQLCCTAKGAGSLPGFLH